MTLRNIGLVAAAVLAVSCTRDPQERARRFVERGDAFASEGRDRAALIEYRNAARERPEWSEAHRKIGDALGRLGEPDDAYRAYAEALNIVDGKPLPRDEAGLRAVVAERPRLVAARIALADLYLLRHDTAGAEEQLLVATEAEPGNELANRGLAALYLATDRIDEAEECLRMAAAQEPQRYRSRLALVDFLLAADRYDEAATWLARAAADPQLETAVKLRQAAIDYAQGRVQPAEDAVAAMIAADPTAAALTLQADFRLRGGRPLDALASARRALDLDPHFAAAQRLVDDIRQRQLLPEAPESLQ